jgi:hypothetical protein
MCFYQRLLLCRMLYKCERQALRPTIMMMMMIASSLFYVHVQQSSDPRQQSDKALTHEIVCELNFASSSHILVTRTFTLFL